MAEKHPKRPRDLNQWAKRIVDIATGETTTASRRQRNAALIWLRQPRAAQADRYERRVCRQNGDAEIAKQATAKRWTK